MYLPENDCSMEYFLSGYLDFTNLLDIKNQGHLVAELTHHKTNLKLTNYPRTGKSIFYEILEIPRIRLGISY